MNDNTTNKNGIRCNAWTRRIVDNMSVIFDESTLDPNYAFLQQQVNINQESNLTPAQKSANMAMRMAMWALVRIHDNENQTVRKHFIRFLEHLEDSELSLQRAMAIMESNPPVKAVQHKPQILANFPLSDE